MGQLFLYQLLLLIILGLLFLIGNIIISPIYSKYDFKNNLFVPKKGNNINCELIDSTQQKEFCFKSQELYKKFSSDSYYNELLSLQNTSNNSVEYLNNISSLTICLMITTFLVVVLTLSKALGGDSDAFNCLFNYLFIMAPITVIVIICDVILNYKICDCSLKINNILNVKREDEYFNSILNELLVKGVEINYKFSSWIMLYFKSVIIYAIIFVVFYIK